MIAIYPVTEYREYAGGTLKTGDAAQPKSCSAGFVPPAEYRMWPEIALFMVIVSFSDLG